MDVHAQSISLALASADHSEARLYGNIPNNLQALEKVFAKLRLAHPGVELRICYEAGPTGLVLARRLAQLKPDCAAVARRLGVDLWRLHTGRATAAELSLQALAPNLITS